VAIAQDTTSTPPCHLQPCGITIDWGSGNTSATYGPDRRYGSGDDFDAKVRSALADHGIRTKEAPAEGALLLTLRPTMLTKAMCDVMAGTGTDYHCTAMSDLAVTFTSKDPGTKAPNALRIPNRCGAGGEYMRMGPFAQYAADVIYFNLEGQKKKEPRPVARC
jgi:hypothetical protein